MKEKAQADILMVRVYRYLFFKKIEILDLGKNIIFESKIILKSRLMSCCIYTMIHSFENRISPVFTSTKNK